MGLHQGVFGKRAPTTNLNARIDARLHRRLKTKAAESGVTLTRLLEDAIADSLESQGKPQSDQDTQRVRRIIASVSMPIGLRIVLIEYFCKGHISMTAIEQIVDQFLGGAQQ